MALISQCKFLAEFKDESLIDRVSNLDLEIGGNDRDIVFADNGYQMKQNQYLFLQDANLSISNAATISFWLFPKNLGRAKDPVTLDILPMRMPLLQIGPGLTNSSDEYAPTSTSLLIYEETLTGNQNRLVIILYSGGVQVYIAKSSAYDADIWHHLLCKYNGSTQTLTLFLDGLTVSLNSTGTVPATINGTTVGVWINRQSFNASYDVLRNTGIIDDLVILNSDLSDILEIQKIINLSPDFAVDVSYSDLEEVDFDILFEDPTAVKITDISDDRSYFYASRTDGRLLQGSPLLWQSRKDFSNENELSVVKKFGTGITQTNGFLNINNGTVRL